MRSTYLDEDRRNRQSKTADQPIVSKYKYDVLTSWLSGHRRSNDHQLIQSILERRRRSADQMVQHMLVRDSRKRA